MSSNDLPAAIARAPHRVIALDWHDGPVVGLAAYDEDGSDAYAFRLVGGVTAERRAFILRRVSKRSWDSLTALLKEQAVAHWPVWVPQLAKGPTEWHARVDAALSSVIDVSAAPFAVIEAESIETQPTAVRRVQSRDDAAQVEEMLATNAGYEDWSRYCRSPELSKGLC